MRELTQALMVFGLGLIQPRLLTSDVLLNKLFHLSHQFQNEVNVGYFVRWLWDLEIIHIGKTIKSSSWHIVDT